MALVAMIAPSTAAHVTASAATTIPSFTARIRDRPGPRMSIVRSVPQEYSLPSTRTVKKAITGTLTNCVQRNAQGMAPGSVNWVTCLSRRAVISAISFSHSRLVSSTSMSSTVNPGGNSVGRAPSRKAWQSTFTSSGGSGSPGLNSTSSTIARSFWNW